MTTTEKSKLEILRGELAIRGKLSERADELLAQINSVAPLEAQLEIAHAKWHAVRDADAKKVQAWIEKGAKGDAPEVDTAARESASREVAKAKAIVEAAGVAREDLAAKWQAVGQEIHEHRFKVGAALMDVLGEEVLLAVEDMRKTSMAVLESEAAFLAIRQQMNSLSDQMKEDVAIGQSFTRLLFAINKANAITDEERQQVMLNGRKRALARTEKLAAGEDPGV